MARVLEMVFTTELGTSKTIRVADANDPLTGAEVATAMNVIVAKNIFKGSGGELTGKIRARVITTTADDVALV